MRSIYLQVERITFHGVLHNSWKQNPSSCFFPNFIDGVIRCSSATPTVTNCVWVCGRVNIHPTKTSTVNKTNTDSNKGLPHFSCSPWWNMMDSQTVEICHVTMWCHYISQWVTDQPGDRKPTGLIPVHNDRRGSCISHIVGIVAYCTSWYLYVQCEAETTTAEWWKSTMT